MTGHGSRNDQATSPSLLEVRSHSLSAVVYTSQIRLNDLLPLINAGLQNTSIRCLASIGNQNINLSEVFDDLVDQLLNVLEVTDIALVWLALDTVLLRDVFGVSLTTLGSRGVGDGNIGAELGTASSCFSADAGLAGGTGDDHDAALEGEEVMEAAVSVSDKTRELCNASAKILVLTKHLDDTTVSQCIQKAQMSI